MDSDLRSAQPIKGSPRVSIVIVTYKGVSFVASCLDTVAAQSYGDAEVVVVENGSADGTAELIRNKYPWVRLVESPSNRGFSGGVNLGVERARGSLIALLNNDGHPAQRWLEELVAVYDKSEAADLVSSVIKNEGAETWRRNTVGP